ncbi:uncharacterized protein F5Z01DRAFT_324510 [Emericellopsis atlantica]|uniref:Uncharacterized protein n=1 Tax=Emericellopsis atlantica TaxID=2614577 RepID=A0A9P7ZTY1_9HYPO|nr:uncharacterized protein F5Z01DRAFT_324510 [Emericellopsis atlantica]KAG9258205.1 hypothetical protein F5Z01DRAFT_324510 [Emericellopsis atlantica]
MQACHCVQCNYIHSSRHGLVSLPIRSRQHRYKEGAHAWNSLRRPRRTVREIHRDYARTRQSLGLPLKVHQRPVRTYARTQQASTPPVCLSFCLPRHDAFGSPVAAKRGFDSSRRNTTHPSRRKIGVYKDTEFAESPSRPNRCTSSLIWRQNDDGGGGGLVVHNSAVGVPSSDVSPLLDRRGCGVSFRPSGASSLSTRPSCTCTLHVPNVH